MQWQTATELHYLKKVVPDTSAWVAFGDMILDFRLLAQLHHSIYVVGQQILTFVTKHFYPANLLTGLLRKQLPEAHPGLVKL